jgi:hypothetical protein
LRRLRANKRRKLFAPWNSAVRRRWFALALMETSDAMIVLGFADGYDDMVEIVRSRIVELNLAQEQYGGYLQK